MTRGLFEDIMIYYAMVNCVAFAMFLLDKIKARAGMWRIRESALVFIAAVGGAGGAMAGMLLFHHKTRKLKFTFFVPLFLALHLAVIGLMWFLSR